MLETNTHYFFWRHQFGQWTLRDMRYPDGLLIRFVIMLTPLKSSLAVLCCVLASYGWSAERVALLIANQNYEDARLYKPLQDVKLIENSLTKLGFVVRVVSDADQKQMQRALRDFGDNAKGAEVAFFYYSGHGLQSNGENYLVPLHASIQKESDIGIEAVATNGLLRQLEEARPKVAVVVLDACRDNPWLTSKGGKGLGRMDSPAGTLVAFATSPNKTAADEGLYAQYLAQYLLEPNVELRKVFDKVGGQIDKATQGKQRPRKDDGLYEDVYLNGKASTQVVERVVEKPVERIVERERVVVQENPQAAEIAYWNSIKNSNRNNDYQAYLSKYPNGLFVEVAQAKLQPKVEVAQVQVRDKPTPQANPSNSDEELMKKGMWRDPKTNLVWMRCSLAQTWNRNTCQNNAEKYTLGEALEIAEAINKQGGFGGYTDWKVPHIEDLLTLRYCSTEFEGTRVIPIKAADNSCKGNNYQKPTINQTIFPNTESGLYWSSSPVVDNIVKAWLVAFNDGNDYYDHKRNEAYVRLVRSSQ